MKPSDRQALDLIHGALDCQEWTSATLSAISVILTAHGYTVRQPLLAFDYGEREEPAAEPAPFWNLKPKAAPLAEQLTRHLSEEEKTARNLEPSINEEARTPCECEDARHFPREYPIANAHPYGNPFPLSDLETIRTHYGAFTVCQDCRQSCGAFQNPEPSTSE